MSSVASPAPFLHRFGDHARGFDLQMRVIFALLMRELHTRYGRENVGYLWMILEPMLLASVIALFHANLHARGGIPPIEFALVGYVNFIMFRGIFNRADGALEANAPLFHHRQVTVVDVMVSRAVLEGVSTFVTFVILSALAWAFGVAAPPARPLFYMLGVLCMFQLSLGLAMIVCGTTHENRTLGRLSHPISYFLLPLSAAFFQISWLPPALRRWMWYVPFSHIFELLRYGYFQSATTQYISGFYLGGWLLVTTFIGLLWCSEVRRRIEL